MIVSLRPFLSGTAMLALTAALIAQQAPDTAPVVPTPAAPTPDATVPAAPAATDAAPTYDVLQFTPDEAFIDLRANLADTWSATLAELAELKYPVNTSLAYVDASGQVSMSDLWVAVEPHVSRSESFTRVRIALNSSTDKDYLQVRAEVILDAVANRLAPPAPQPQFGYPTAQAEPAQPADQAATVAPSTTIYQTTYVPYYLPTPICDPYYTPYYSSFACWHQTSCWWNNCWLGSGWPCSSWNNGFGFGFGFGNCGWHWGFSGCWGNLCGNFWSPWCAGPNCGWWGHPNCGWWNGGACTTGFWPCGSNGASFSGSIVVGDHIAAVAQHDFHFNRVSLDGGAIHKTQPSDFVTAPLAGKPTLRVTARERRDVPAADLHRPIVVVRSEPRRSRGNESTPSTRSPGVNGSVVTVRSGPSAPRAGTVVRLPSANYDSRTSRIPSGRVGSLSAPESNSGTVSSSPLVVGGASAPASRSSTPASGSASGSNGTFRSSGTSSTSVAVAPGAPVFYGSSSAPSRGTTAVVTAPASGSATSVVSVPRTWSAPVSGHQGGEWSAPPSTRSSAPSAPSMPSMPSGRGSSTHSFGSAGSAGPSGSAGGHGFGGRGR